MNSIQPIYGSVSLLRRDPVQYPKPTQPEVPLQQLPKNDAVQKAVCKFFMNGGCKKNPCKFEHPLITKPKTTSYKDRPIIRPPETKTDPQPAPKVIKVTFLNEKKHHIIGHTAVRDNDNIALTKALENSKSKYDALDSDTES